jgi:hypothetical protein
MKRASLLAATAVVLVANAFALVHAWRNRSGPMESDITLTERELPLSYNSNDEDSGVALNLRWTNPQAMFLYSVANPSPWMDQKALQELGFDTSVAPSDNAASEFYARQRPRRAFVALEYDGPSWHKWMDDVEHQAQGQSPRPAYVGPANQRETSTRLVATDASSDAGRLRGRHPGQGSVVVVPVVIRIGVQRQGAERSARLYGSIQEIPSTIHVPLPFSDAFRRLPRDRNNLKYFIHLRYGASLEPWIVGVEFPTPASR